MKRWSALLVLAVGQMISPPSLDACSCGFGMTIELAYRRAAAVFVGTAVRIERVRPEEVRQSDNGFLPPDTQEVTFEVERRWRGPESSTIAVRGAGHEFSCSREFNVGRRYLVYADDSGDGVLRTSSCHRGHVVWANDRPDPELEELDELAFGIGAPTPEQQREIEAVGEVFAAFQSAAGAGSYGLAASFVCANLGDYYDSLRELAMQAPKETLLRQKVVAVIYVLSLRRDFDRRTLLAATRSQLVEAHLARYQESSALQRGEVTLGRVTIDGDQAAAALSLRGTTVSGWRQEFRKVEGAWCIDLGPRQSEETMESYRQLEQYLDHGLEDFLLGLAAPGDETPDASLWEPLADRP